MTDPFPLSQCQTVSTLGFERLDTSKYLMEPKVDGWRIQFDVTRHEIRAWTRTGKDASRKMPMVEHHLKHLLGPAGHLRLDGEAVMINEDGTPDYNLTARCLGSGVETCVAKQAELGRHLSYFVFDILALGNTDLRAFRLDDRKWRLKEHISDTGNVVPVLGVEPSFDQHIENFETYFEGSVLKDLSAPYMGRRHKAWLKWKETETCDVRIINYKPGEGKFMGLIGAIKWKDPKTGVIGYCSGMDDATRVYISDHRTDLLGYWIEIKHYGRLVDGYRHPQFVRFREDRA